MTKKKTVLFLCTHNSARSQMAEALVNALYGSHYKAFSAGILPTHVNPYAIEVMKELGVDLSTHRSKHVDEYKNDSFDFVVTVCDHAKEHCPFFPGKKIVHKGFTDPAAVDGSIEEILDSFTQVRDEIKHWIKSMFSSPRG